MTTMRFPVFFPCCGTKIVIKFFRIIEVFQIRPSEMDTGFKILYPKIATHIKKKKKKKIKDGHLLAKVLPKLHYLGLLNEQM